MLQEQLLKLVPQQQQIQYYGGTPVDFGVRVGTSLVVTLAASKIPLLAAGTLFYPFWWPIYKAWAQNQKIRQYRYVCVQEGSKPELPWLDDVLAAAVALQHHMRCR